MALYSVTVKQTLPLVGGSTWRLMHYTTAISIVLLAPVLVLTGLCPCTYLCVCVCVYIYIYIYIQKYIHTHAYAHTEQGRLMHYTTAIPMVILAPVLVLTGVCAHTGEVHQAFR